jgi:hypothetical protein
VDPNPRIFAGSEFEKSSDTDSDSDTVFKEKLSKIADQSLEKEEKKFSMTKLVFCNKFPDHI